MTRVQKTVFVLIALVALVLGLTVHKVLNNQRQADPTQLLDAGIAAAAEPHPAVHQPHRPGRQAGGGQRAQDKWSLLFFGYTFCPDICPTTLAQMRELKGLLPEAARNNLRVVLVSVDPNRDTPQQLKQYLGYFDPAFVGYTGELASIQKLANAVSIPFIPADTSKENYTVDHSGNLVVIGPDGTQRGFIRAPLNNQKLKDQLPTLLAPAS